MNIECPNASPPLREEPETGNTVTYFLDTKTLFKAEPNVRYAKEISFVTNKSSAACGVTLEIGKQYLIGLGRDDDGQLSASSCGLVRRWNAVTKEERASIRAGCEDDPCDGSCGEFQVRSQCAKKTVSICKLNPSCEPGDFLMG